MPDLRRGPALLAVLAACLMTVRAAPREDAPPGAPLRGADTQELTEGGAIFGHVELLLGAGRREPAEDAAVWIPGLSGTAPRGLSIASKDKRFQPHVLIVPTGAKVSFPNADAIYHNAFSLTPGAEFDLGLYRGGASKEVVFPHEGVVRVFCNIHPRMAAYVLVLDRAAAAVTDDKGRFRLSGVPPGRYTLHVWHEKTGAIEVPVDAGAEGGHEVRAVLDASGWKDVPHTNKHGEEYPKGRADERY